MTRFASLLALAAAALFALGGCSDYWSSGPDPGRAGPFEGTLPPSAGTSSGANGSGANGSGANGNCNPGPCGSGGNAGTGEVGTVLTSNIGHGVNDLALDDDFVYFATDQGIARVSKQGGEPEPLGGFGNINGLAVENGNVYLVEDSGAVMSVALDGFKSTTIVPGTFGGGSGPIVLDAMNLFFIVGPYLRRAPVKGGAAGQLTDDVFSGGFPGHRLALDASFAYYVAGMDGGNAQLNKIEKNAAAAVDQQPQPRMGTPVAKVEGRIGAVIWDGEFIYFTQITSNGLKTQLEVRKVETADGPPTVLVTVTPNSPDPNAGGALATDGHDLFFSGAWGLYKFPNTGGQLETIDEQANTNAIAVDDTSIFWADGRQNGTIKRLPK